jgi:hypothetical protein
MKIEANLMNVNVKDCPRCKQDHLQSSLYATPFVPAIAGGYTHFAMCPTLNQPILIRVSGEQD